MQAGGGEIPGGGRPGSARVAALMTTGDRVLLWVAEGFGSGRIRPGPGTWGSVVGLGLAVPLLRLPLWAFTSVAVVLAAVAVPVCGAGERLLKRADPGSVVFDEIVAMPLVFLPLACWLKSAGPKSDLSGAWPVWIAGFLLFRLFDIWKPWPIRPLQNFHGGLGVVLDDIAAALVAGAILVPLAWPLLPRH